MALARKNRIEAENDFEFIFKEGKTVKSSFFFIKYLNNSLGYLRCGLVVPIKISKKSVDRNRIRRILSEAIKNFLNISIDAIITATPLILEKSSDEIKRQIDLAIKKIHVNTNL
jgi:ribonuclease P protein component